MYTLYNENARIDAGTTIVCSQPTKITRSTWRRSSSSIKIDSCHLGFIGRCKVYYHILVYTCRINAIFDTKLSTPVNIARARSATTSR